jgi:hypothetical protein
MNAGQTRLGFAIVSGALLMTVVSVTTAATAEVFTATATVKSAGGQSTSAPVTITVDRTMPDSEAAPLVAAFKSGGADALRKALAGVPPTGSVRIGDGQVIPTRFTIERASGGGRRLTILTEETLVFIGGGGPNAVQRAGYDFAIVDFQVDASGGGSGTLAPAARLKLNGGAFVVEDYTGDVVRLTAITRSR